MALSLRQLVYFVTVAEEGQMTRAAGKLHLAQPALSQAIAQLERQMGVQLLTRHARGVSMTPAGEALFEKARAALAAVTEVDLAGESLARASASKLVLGFLGPSPMIDAPELFEAFTWSHPEVEISYRALDFPRESTAAWVDSVDVGLCFQPTPHEQVSLQPLRVEPRVLLVGPSHHLVGRTELAVAEVLDETFCGTDPSLEPVRAGFWRLDDHRGGPGRVTDDRAINPFEVAAAVASGRAVATTPASNAEHVRRALTSLLAIPLVDAKPAALELVWRNERETALVRDLAATGRSLFTGGAGAPGDQA
jgi:DNA-binding transcriptional LysR family regulator